MKIYISLPITGFPKWEKDCERYKKELETFGHEVFTPMDFDATNLTETECLIECFKLQARCEKTVFFGDWRSSNGCMMEYYHARKLNHQTNPETLQTLIDSVNARFNLDIRSRKRTKENAAARQIYYDAARSFTNETVENIAKSIGFDHSSVSHGIKKVSERNFNPFLNQYYKEFHGIFK